MFRSVREAACLAAAGAFLVLPVIAQTPVYHAEYIGPAKHVAAMNESGLVVGTGTLGLHQRAYVAGPGKAMTFLPLPLGFLSSGARDVNEAGVIVGVMSPYQTTGFYPQPVRWDPDGAGGWVPTLLATLPGHNRGTADAINDLGDILGTSAYQADMHTVLFTPKGTLDLPGFAQYPAQSLNNQRVWVGAGSWRADLDTLVVEDLGVPPGFSAAHGWIVNDLGQVAGDVTGGTGCAQRVALHADGLGWQPLGSCGTASEAYDLNEHGDLLVTQGSVPWVAYSGGGMYRVEDLISAPSGHWTVNAPFNMAMNTARQMAVYATNGGLDGIILLTPETQVCQADLGFGGPGAMELSFCGGDLSTGTVADLRLAGALPSDAALLLAGAASQPTPFKGGTLVPVPFGLVMALATDATGHAAIVGVPGGGGPFSVVLQAAQHDAAQPKGWALSNAVKADFLP